MSKYTYNDDESLTANLADTLTSRVGDGSGDPEQVYLETVALLMSLNRNGAFLDVGAGFGRITALAAQRMAEVTAIEPDAKRCAYLRDTCQSSPAVTVLNMLSGEYRAANPQKRFNLITASMVIQHLSTTDCTRLLGDVAAMLDEDGLAVISTTHGTEKTAGFRRSRKPDRITEAQFNAYFDDNAGQQHGLPVRRFSKADLEAVVTPHLDIIHWAQYSYIRPEKVDWYCHNLQAEPEDIRDVANSQFVIARKKANR